MPQIVHLRTPVQPGGLDGGLEDPVAEPVPAYVPGLLNCFRNRGLRLAVPARPAPRGPVGGDRLPALLAPARTLRIRLQRPVRERAPRNLECQRFPLSRQESVLRPPGLSADGGEHQRLPAPPGQQSREPIGQFAADSDPTPVLVLRVRLDPEPALPSRAILSDPPRSPSARPSTRMRPGPDLRRATPRTRPTGIRTQAARPPSAGHSRHAGGSAAAHTRPGGRIFSSACTTASAATPRHG